MIVVYGAVMERVKGLEPSTISLEG
jgi:hypothetical protein